MSLRREFSKLGALFRRRKPVDDLEEEIRAHLEMEEQENLESGMPPEEAHYAALRRFGNVTRAQERSREMWGWSSIETLWQDLRYGLRQLRRSPGFTAVAVLTLALGIGANTAIFTVVKAVVLHPLPYPHSDRLVWITERDTMVKRAGALVDWDGYVAWKEQARTIEQVAACLGSFSFNLTGHGASVHVFGEVVSANFFAMLGVVPQLGRSFTEEDEQRGDRVVVLTHAFWQEYFGSDPHLLGRVLTLDAAPYTVVGVMPIGFRFPGDSDAQMLLPRGPAGIRSEGYPDSSKNTVGFIGRLKPGGSIGVSQTELAAIRKRAGVNWTEVELKVVPLADHLGGNLRPAMLVLLGVVCAVLLIACANVANLMLTRASARTREMAVRTALGASGWRLVRQLLAESVTLALAGGVAGLLLAAGGVNIMVRFIPASAGGNILSLARPHVDGTILLFALAVSCLTGVLFGLVPALAAARPDLVEGLKDGGQMTSGGRHRDWLRETLGVAEFSLAMVLLIGAGLLIKSFYRILSVDPGFAPERVLTMDITLTDTRYPTDQQKHAFFSELLREVESLPGVRSATLASSLPLSPYAELDVAPLAHLAPAAGYSPSAAIFMPRYDVSPSYFHTLGIPLLRGRTFTGHNDQQSVTEVVVSERLASRVWPEENPVGKTYTVFFHQETVIGEVGNIRHEGLNQDFQAEIYESCSWRGRDMKLAVRTAVDPASMVPAIRERVRAIDPDQPIYNVATLEQVLSDSVTPQRLNVLLLGVFAFIALALATVGIYGVMAFSVAQQTNEIGIRMALGAERGDVLGLVVGRGLRLTTVGVIVGLSGAWALTRFLTSFLFGVRPTDVGTYAVVSLGLASVSLLACYFPARRATKVDPMVALRHE
jgi:putative ABC transport system permease protein